MSSMSTPEQDMKIIQALMAIPISPRQAELLQVMRDRDEWLAQDGLDVWVDLERTSASMVFRMLLQMQIKPVGSFHQTMVGLTYYEITATGREALERYDAQNQARKAGPVRG